MFRRVSTWILHFRTLHAHLAEERQWNSIHQYIHEAFEFNLIVSGRNMVCCHNGKDEIPALMGSRRVFLSPMLSLIGVEGSGRFLTLLCFLSPSRYSVYLQTYLICLSGHIAKSVFSAALTLTPSNKSAPYYWMLLRMHESLNLNLQTWLKAESTLIPSTYNSTNFILSHYLQLCFVVCVNKIKINW